MQKSTYAQEINRILASMNTNGSDASKDLQPLDTPQKEAEIEEEFDVYIEEDRITVIKRPEPEAQVIDAVQQSPQRQPRQTLLEPYFAYIAMTISLLLIFYLVTSAMLTVFFPPVVTITLLLKSQTIKATATLQLQARIIPPITLSESMSAQTTGHGHQDARSAIGSITFYNGQFNDVTIPAGTTLTGRSGAPITTDKNAVIPAASINPPAFGYITVSAHAINLGKNGNIAAYDINSPCCFASVIAKNQENFTGGQDERDFPIVTKGDIDNAASTPKAIIAENMQAALQAERKQNETLIPLPCSRAVTPNHNIGEEATQVTVTVSETCQGYAYSQADFFAQAATILSRLAVKKLGSGYTLRGTIHVTQTATRVTKNSVIIAFTSQGLYGYALSQKAQSHIKYLLAGKRKQDAERILRLLPGIHQAFITGIDDLAKLPKNPNDIHMSIIFPESS